MRKKVVTREAIIRECLKIIEKEGAEKCTIRSLAKSMNIAVGTVYNYFESFDNIILEAFQTSWYETQVKVENIATSDKSTYNRIIEIFDITLKDVKKRNDLGRKIYKMYLDSSNQYFMKIHDQFRVVFANILKETSKDSKENDALANWLVIILFDHVPKKLPLSESECLLIKKLTTKCN